MSAEKLKERKDDPAATQCLAECVNAHVLTWIVRNLLLQQSMSSAALEERAQDSLQEQRARGFALFNIPHIAKSLMPVDNDGMGVAEPFAAIAKAKATR
jgi:hypothetical protein